MLTIFAVRIILPNSLHGTSCCVIACWGILCKHFYIFVIFHATTFCLCYGHSHVKIKLIVSHLAHDVVLCILEQGSCAVV